MNHLTTSSLLATALLAGGAVAQQFDGKLPMYPGAHSLNDVPAAAIKSGVPLVAETADPVDTVDGWYKSNATSCTRSSQTGSVKYQCSGGSIMIYQHQGRTQVAYVPSMF